MPPIVDLCAFNYTPPVVEIPISNLEDVFQHPSWKTDADLRDN